MSVYNSRLNDLMTLLQGRAIDPSQAVQSVWDLEDQRRENRQARAASQQDALTSLLSNVRDAAAEGTPLSTLSAQMGGPQALAPAADVLGQLYSPQGYSTLKPMLDPEDEGAIEDSVYRMLGHRTDPTASHTTTTPRTDLGTIRNQIIGQLGLAPQDLNALGPAIDEVITRAYSSAVRMPTSGYLDQYATPPG